MTVSDDIFKNAFSRHEDAVRRSAQEILPDVSRAADIIVEAIQGCGKLLVCGNGGSAADAQHLVAEFLCKYRKDRRPLSAIALTVNTSALIAIGNDFGFEEVFRRQVEALGAKGDVLVAISTSGKSPNVLLAMEEAKKRSLKVIALTGARGAGMRKFSDVLIAVPSNETARIQEVHELIYHCWCEYVDHKLEDSEQDPHD